MGQRPCLMSSHKRKNVQTKSHRTARPTHVPLACNPGAERCLLFDMQTKSHWTAFQPTFRLPAILVQNDACFLSCDGGRVCRPLIICDNGVPRVRQEHIGNLTSGVCLRVCVVCVCLVCVCCVCVCLVCVCVCVRVCVYVCVCIRVCV